ncbi:hypothetical protein O181_045139 [Austropuccinia psidii MF-1]|uniref:Uncharacterized protein n=1 Tax=Austropuccinia psidii MF-1 TaxID=1389203 RepID=A0A9Q3DLL7_9BASI|nr:hypothetical protein [Austropuccinia psidii MF-1]
MGQDLSKGAPKLKELPQFSGEGESDHMELIRGIHKIKEDFSLPKRFVKARFNTCFTISAHRCYIKLRQTHEHQSWTWWKTQIIPNGAMMLGDLWLKQTLNMLNLILKKTKVYHGFSKKRDRLTELYPEMSEFLIHRKILRKCGGDSEHAFKSRTTEQSSAKYIINILEEVTTRTRIGSSRVNLKTIFNTRWKDSADKIPKENCNNTKYKSAVVLRKCHIFQRTTHLANTCPKNGKMNEIDIEKEPDVEMDEVNEDNSDDKSSIFSEFLKDIENINATFYIMDSYSHLPQLSNGQLDLSRIQDAQLMKTKQNRGKGYTAGNS